MAGGVPEGGVPDGGVPEIEPEPLAKLPFPGAPDIDGGIPEPEGKWPEPVPCGIIEPEGIAPEGLAPEGFEPEGKSEDA